MWPPTVYSYDLIWQRYPLSGVVIDYGQGLGTRSMLARNRQCGLQPSVHKFHTDCRHHFPHQLYTDVKTKVVAEQENRLIWFPSL